MNVQTVQIFIHVHPDIIKVSLMAVRSIFFLHSNELMCMFVLCRRMFPPLRVSFTGLDPNQTYAVVLDVVPLDNKRHRYSYTDSAWFVAGEADPTPPRRVYTHPESPFTGEELARQVLSFERVKLTNNPKDSNGNVSS